MNIKNYLKDKFKNKILSEQQIKNFDWIISEIESVLSKTNNSDLTISVESSIMKVSDLNTIGFSEKYNHWLYDNVTGLFFTNVYKSHDKLRKALLFLHLIVLDKEIELFDYNNKKETYDDYYISLNLGFYHTGSFIMGGGKTVICSPLVSLQKYSFLRNYRIESMIDPEINIVKNKFNL